MANPGTRFNKIVSVGAPLSAFAALAATVMLYVFGNFQLHGVLKFEGLPTEITQSGSTTTAVVSFRADINAMTATGATAAVGANGKYPTFQWQNPKTQTAALLSFCLDIYTAPSPATTTSCYINNEDIAGSGSAVYLFKYIALSKGHLCFNTQVAQSGSYLRTVGPNEHIKCSNSLGAGSGQGLVGEGRVIYGTNRL